MTLSPNWRALLGVSLAKHGGRFHGPRVETLTMPEEAFWRFMGDAIEAAKQSGRDEVLNGPVPELKGAKPIVLYFGSDADRDEFAAAVAEAKPGMTTRKL